MPAAARLGDLCTGHDCHPPRPNVSGSPNVFSNGLPAHRVTDAWAVHACGSDAHASIQATGSPNVFVNGLPLARIGDAVACGSAVATGSPNVFANG